VLWLTVYSRIRSIAPSVADSDGAPPPPSQVTLPGQVIDPAAPEPGRLRCGTAEDRSEVETPPASQHDTSGVPLG